MKTVLVLLDDPVVNEVLAATFRHAGFHPVSAVTLADAERVARQLEPDLLLVDADAHDPVRVGALFDRPERGGGVRRVPVIRVCSRPGPHCGAGCTGVPCEPKPLRSRELVMKAVRMVRRSSARVVDVRWMGTLRRGPIELDLDRFTMTVDVGGRTVPFGLGPTVSRLMARLMDRPGVACGREELLAQVWPDDRSVTPRTVDQNVRRIRSALRTVGMEDAIRTIPGHGYGFVVPDPPRKGVAANLPVRTTDRDTP